VTSTASCFETGSFARSLECLQTLLFYCATVSDVALFYSVTTATRCTTPTCAHTDVRPQHISVCAHRIVCTCTVHATAVKCLLYTSEQVWDSRVRLGVFVPTTPCRPGWRLQCCVISKKTVCVISRSLTLGLCWSCCAGCLWMMKTPARFLCCVSLRCTQVARCLSQHTPRQDGMARDR
jgi:hypothetical protein